MMMMMTGQKQSMLCVAICHMTIWIGAIDACDKNRMTLGFFSVPRKEERACCHMVVTNNVTLD